MATDWSTEFDTLQRHELLLSITASIPDVYYWVFTVGIAAEAEVEMPLKYIFIT